MLNYYEKLEIDHINRDGLDNRKTNLRIVTVSENRVNVPYRNKLKEKNIYYKGNGFTVYITRDNKQIYLGSYKTKEEAVKVRDLFIDDYNKEHNRAV